MKLVLIKPPALALSNGGDTKLEGGTGWLFSIQEQDEMPGR